MIKQEIIIDKLTPNDIPELNMDNTLYVSDFRGTGESLNYEIYSMYAYEGLSNFLIGTSAVNSYAIDFDAKKKMPFAPVGEKYSDSVISRLRNVPESITGIWMAVPHPDADRYARAHRLKINYYYDKFLLYNNKLTQKKLLRRYTPDFKLIKSVNDVLNATKNLDCFIKIAIGSGGYNIYDMSNTEDVKKVKENANTISMGGWFIENRALGVPMSIQIYKSSNRHTVFGLTKQYIDNGSNYVGSNILGLSAIKPLEKQINEIIDNISTLIDDYTGFYGIDFILNEEGEMKVLELNVRVTAATVPTLLINSYNGDSMKNEYFENYQDAKLSRGEVIKLTNTPDNQPTLAMVIEKPVKHKDAGKSYYLQLSNCKKLDPKASVELINQLKVLINSTVSRVQTSSYNNFWPYGWTISYILAESHIVFSSWHKEKNVLIDLFCCKKIELDQFLSGLRDIFDCDVTKTSVKSRRII